MNESNAVIHVTKLHVHFMKLKSTVSESGKMKKNRDLEAGGEYLIRFLCARSVTPVAAEGELTLPADERSCCVGKPGSSIELTNAEATSTENETPAQEKRGGRSRRVVAVCAG
jgi:hypothetical protein